MEELFNQLNEYLETNHEMHRELEKKHNFNEEEIMKDTLHFHLNGVAFGLRTALDTINAMEEDLMDEDELMLSLGGESFVGYSSDITQEYLNNDY